MMFHEASKPSLLAFDSICLFIVFALLCAVWRSAIFDSVNPRLRSGGVLMGALGWTAAVSLVICSGWVAAKPMPRLLVFFGLVNAVSLCIGLSRVGRWIAKGFSIGWLLAFQGFRLPLEVILHGWARDGVIPSSMTWSGSNWDVVSGIIALLLAPLANRSRGLAWLANAAGFVLFLNIARAAVLSSPVPFGWPVKPSLQLVFHLPYGLILPICVGGALIGHIALTRALIANSREFKKPDQSSEPTVASVMSPAGQEPRLP